MKNKIQISDCAIGGREVKVQKPPSQKGTLSKGFFIPTQVDSRLRGKNFGTRRIQSELTHHYEFRLSLATIH